MFRLFIGITAILVAIALTKEALSLSDYAVTTTIKCVFVVAISLQLAHIIRGKVRRLARVRG